MKSKIDYKDLMITTTIQAVISALIGWSAANFIMIFIFACFFGVLENQVDSTSIISAFVGTFFIHLYDNYRLQKNIIKHSLLQTFEN